MRTPFLITLALLTALAAGQPAAALEDSQILPGAQRIGHISAGGLKGRCDSAGGTYIETSEEYGCAGNGGWVYCEKSSGDCVGGRTNDSQAAQGMNRQMNHLGKGQRLHMPSRQQAGKTPPAALELQPAQTMKLRSRKVPGVKP